MIDTHAHLNFKDFDRDRDKVLSRFFADKGRAVVNIGVDEKSNRWGVKFAEKQENVFATVSYHPEEAGKVKPEKAMEELAELAQGEKVVAIGEIGLDYFHNSENKKEQKKLFEAQLDLATKLRKPIIIHCRDSYQDVYNILKSNVNCQMSNVVIHCYQGDRKWTEKFLALGVMFSFTGNITFEKNDEAEIFEVIKMIPLEKIMTETDCPYLAPVPQRGKRNEPAFVRHVIEKIAEIKSLRPNKVEEQTDRTAINFFNLPIGH